MTISVLSQYLYHLFERLPKYRRDDFLRIIYLIELIDYHKRNLDLAQGRDQSHCDWLGGKLVPPSDWKTSLYIKDPIELSHYWSHLVSIIEFEAFLTGVVRFSDVAFINLNKEIMGAAQKQNIVSEKEISHIKNIGAYCEKKNKKQYKFLQNNPYNPILEEAWKDWLEDLTNLRHLITHKMPFGGRTWSHGQIPIDGALYDVLFLPRFSDLRKSNIDFMDILKISFEEPSGFPEMLKRNSKAYTDETHTKVHKLVEKLLMVETY